MLETVQSSESRTYGNTNWIDQLTSINGTDITYDNMGNPFKWHNASSLTWEGRKLKTFTKTDGTVISYTYDENGIRTGKKIGSESVEYVLSGSNIIQEKRANYTLTFLYDGDTLVGFNYKAGTTNADYYYGIDNFGNINYIYDANGNIVVTYKYDAWGKAISITGSLASTIGAINPYRYKSYYFDSEIQMYYLQSRYYDAGVQRFVSADDTMYLGINGVIYSYNLYAYCADDPVNNRELYGYFRLSLSVASFIIDALLYAIPYLVGLFKSAKIFSKAARFTIWGRNMIDKLVKQISKGIMGLIEEIVYKWAGHVAQAAATAFLRKGIETIVAGVLNLSPGYIIAYIISLFGKEPGKAISF